MAGEVRNDSADPDTRQHKPSDCSPLCEAPIFLQPLATQFLLGLLIRLEDGPLVVDGGRMLL